MAPEPAPAKLGQQQRELEARRPTSDLIGGEDHEEALEIGGLIAGVVLIAFGIGAIALSVNGNSTVKDNLAAQHIVGSPDMTPAGDHRRGEEGRPGRAKLDIPTKSVANEPINTGSKARTFAQYMNIHALEATGGLTFSQMGRFMAKPGTPKSRARGKGATSNSEWALVDPQTKQPVENGLRNVWIQETALTSALNLAFTASQIALFGLVVGIALLLSGIGFLVLALGGALESERLFWAIKPKAQEPSRRSWRSSSAHTAEDLEAPAREPRAVPRVSRRRRRGAGRRGSAPKSGSPM